MPTKKKTKTKFDLKRPPVVTMLGHVDHGKTSLLDAIRGTKVQEGEAGGITQTVRAHQIEYKKGKETYKISFIDTPGHEAFTEMRSRGAQVTDIAVLVVAVDDGVQPQTKEAIKFIKKSKVPVVVALNKVDLEGIQKAKVKRQLAENDVQVEELGGDVMIVETSAKKKTGLDELLEAILLTAELHELKIPKPKVGKADAVVLESTLDTCLGAISLVLLKSGTIQVGDYIIGEKEETKVRAIKDEFLKSTATAETSDIVWIVGFKNEIPVGVILHTFNSPQEAKQSKQKVKKKVKKAKDEKDEEESELGSEMLSMLIESQESEDIPTLSLVVKTDSQGTLEVVTKELEKLSSDEVKIEIVEAETGEISEDDIYKASSAGGIVIGFKTMLCKGTDKVAKQEKVLIKNYDIIYELIDEIGEVLEGFLEPEEKEIETARVLIKKVFELSDGSKIAGCSVSKGTILKGNRCYVERPGKKEAERIGEGKITSLKHGKDEVREAPKGTECGIAMEPEIEFEKGDEIVCFKIEKV